ncbi:MAG: hypothetical protein ACYC3I_17685, partial [Gemmataceae bacterium]
MAHRRDLPLALFPPEYVLGPMDLFSLSSLLQYMRHFPLGRERILLRRGRGNTFDNAALTKFGGEGLGVWGQETSAHPAPPRIP